MTKLVFSAVGFLLPFALSRGWGSITQLWVVSSCSRFFVYIWVRLY
jgi:hypothetical protein